VKVSAAMPRAVTMRGKRVGRMLTAASAASVKLVYPPARTRPAKKKSLRINHAQNVAATNRQVQRLHRLLRAAIARRVVRIWLLSLRRALRRKTRSLR
jgi:hypothetical protein